MASELAAQPVSSRSDATDSVICLAVVRDLARFDAWCALHQLDYQVAYRRGKIVKLKVTPAFFRDSLKLAPEITDFNTAPENPREELPVPGHNLFVNRINAAQHYFPARNGSEFVISIREYGFDTTDIDLLNRVQDSPLADSLHTTHAALMATLCGGAGISDLAAQGAAPVAGMMSSGFGDLLPEDIPGFNVQNHSYGVDPQPYYGINAFAYDLAANVDTTRLSVFSAGNQGFDTVNDGKYAHIPGACTLTGNFKMAKNVLVVGAVDSTGQIPAFSSRGPAFDGRIKPDLVAFGQDGTSGAAALVSGAAAVLMDEMTYYTNKIPGIEFIRGALMHSADEIGAPGPDFAGGYGNLSLYTAEQLIRDRHYSFGVFNPNETSHHSIAVPANAANFKVTLSWLDPLAAVGAEKALKNDLNLSVSDPTGTISLPWVLNPYPDPDSLAMPARRGIDTLNNIEQVLIEKPVAGNFDIQVSGTATSTQSYVVFYSWENADSLEWTCPLKNDPMLAGQEAILYWHSTLAATHAALEWKEIHATQWQPIEIQADVSAGYHRWLLPDTFAEAQVRARAGSQVFPSDTFLIARPLRMHIAFDCADSVGIYWNALAPNIQYQLSGLGDKRMEPLFRTRDTFVVLQKNQFPQLRFAVAAVGPQSGALGRRSPAPDIHNQGVSCFQKRFTAEFDENRQVQITLEIASTYSLSRIVLEKESGANFMPLTVFSPVDQFSYAWLDEHPEQGRNAYRALFYSNSGIISSDTAVVYYEGGQVVLLFPNPARPNGVLQVVSNATGDVIFKMYDVTGRLVIYQKLEEQHEQIPLNGLASGIYFCQVIENGRRQWSGVVVVE